MTQVDPVHHRPGSLALVALGGFVGALARYAVSRLLPGSPDGFPVATFVTNLSGALLLGLLVAVLARDPSGREDGRSVGRARLLLGTGLLGAFTTYSTLAVEVTLLGRDGRVGIALGYGLASAVLGPAAAAAGVLLGARVRPT